MSVLSVDDESLDWIGEGVGGDGGFSFREQLPGTGLRWEVGGVNASEDPLR